MTGRDRVERLIPEQEAQLAPYRDQWLAHGLSTDRADRPRAEAGVRAAYEAAGLKPPTIFIWLESPLAGCIGAAMLAGLKTGDQFWDQFGDQVRDQVRDQFGDQVRGQVWGQVRGQVWCQVWDQFGDQVGGQVRGQVGDQVGGQVRDQVRDQFGGQVWGQFGDQVWDQFGDQVRDQVRDQFGDQVWDQFGDQVRDQVWDQVWDQFGDQVGGQFGDQVRDQVYRAVYGQHDAGWISFYDYMHRVVGIRDAARLHGINEIAQSAGWWWPFASAVILTERPTVLHRDPDNRLHCADGPALSYPDGWSVYAWHGTRVPASLITGDGWSVQETLAEENLEIRRCAIERMGWDQFIAAADLRPVHRCDDPGNPGHGITLYDLPDEMNPYEEPVRILLCANGSVERDGTRRRFGLSVPANIPTALAAAAWGYEDPDHPVRMTPDLYATTARRS